MSVWKPIGPETMLADGEMKEVQVGEVSILLARAEGNYYATQSLCPHLQTRLAIGTLDGFVLTCRAHRSQFDVRDGRNLAWIPKLPRLARRIAQAMKQPEDLRTYATRVQDGQVWVEIG
jgi:nitrite reductase/ring-hydroxylating ferredoxin subunit